jgi:hypothetical protein
MYVNSSDPNFFLRVDINQLSRRSPADLAEATFGMKPARSSFLLRAQTIADSIVRVSVFPRVPVPAARPFLGADANPPQLTDQPVGRFRVEKVVAEAEGPNHVQVRAVLDAPAREHDMVELVAGDRERVVQAAVGRAPRFPGVGPELSRFVSALPQPAHNIRNTIAHHEIALPGDLRREEACYSRYYRRDRE